MRKRYQHGKQVKKQRCTNLFVCKGELETSFCGVNADNSGPRFPVETEELILDHTCCVDRVIKSTDGASITSREAILYMMKGSINEKVGAGAS